MKRRDPELERARWNNAALFKRGRWLRRSRAWVSAFVAGALGFGAVLVVGVVLFGPAGAVTEGWPMEQASR